VNPYEILGVAPTAEPDEAEAAYRSLLRAWHPDLHQVDGPAAVAEAEARTRELNEAIAWIRSGWRPTAAAGTAGHATGWAPPSDEQDWFGNPADGRRRSVPCPFCGVPFTHLASYEWHLGHAHHLRDLADGRRQPRRNGLVRALGNLRYVPVWLALLIAVLLLWALPGVLYPLPFAFVALVLWTQTSPLFRPSRTTPRRPSTPPH
jgi:hypothetical protein